MTHSRREFFERLAIGGGLIAGGDQLIKSHAPTIAKGQGTNLTDSQIGNLYPFVQKQADQSPLSLSFKR